MCTFTEKMWVACKCKSYSHFFSKNISISAIFNDQSFNYMLTNDTVSFEQLGQECRKLFFHDWVKVLRPSKPIRVMFLGRLNPETKHLTSIWAHSFARMTNALLEPVGERMTVFENISWLVSTKDWCQTWWGSNLWPPDHQMLIWRSHWGQLFVPWKDVVVLTRRHSNTYHNIPFHWEIRYIYILLGRKKKKKNFQSSDTFCRKKCLTFPKEVIWCFTAFSTLLLSHTETKKALL